MHSLESPTPIFCARSASVKAINVLTLERKAQVNVPVISASTARTAKASSTACDICAKADAPASAWEWLFPVNLVASSRIMFNRCCKNLWGRAPMSSNIYPVPVAGVPDLPPPSSRSMGISRNIINMQVGFGAQFLKRSKWGESLISRCLSFFFAIGTDKREPKVQNGASRETTPH